MGSSGQVAPQLIENPVGQLAAAGYEGPDGALVYLRAAPAAVSSEQARSDAVELRLQALEARAHELSSVVGSVRAIVALLERRTCELEELEARIAMLGADLAARERPPRRRRAQQPCPLSSRELEVLISLSDGKVYKQIAREMSLSVSTVRSHLHHAYAKLDVPDRAQAVLLATKRGWI